MSVLWKEEISNRLIFCSSFRYVTTNNLSVYPSICPSVYQSVYTSVYLSIYSSMSLFLPISLSTHGTYNQVDLLPFNQLFQTTLIYLPIYLSICLPTYPPLYLSICLIIYLSLYIYFPPHDKYPTGVSRKIACMLSPKAD